MNRYLGITLLILAGLFFYFKKPQRPAVATEDSRTQVTAKRTMPPPAPTLVKATPTASPPLAMPKIKAQAAPNPLDTSKKSLVLPYHLEGELAVVQGDVLVGAIFTPDAPEIGRANVPALKLWPSHVIAFHIQPNLPNPDRVQQAIALFGETNVQFVPFSGQTDALIFDVGEGVCKSYVGHVVAQQPIFLPADCGPHEIAHEIMHALGFIHEQNRDDRDNFIEVTVDNIEDKYRDNFEKLPPDYMKVSGLSTFDYTSIMIYPPMMFAKGSRPTMQSIDKYKPIQPGHGLSAIDLERINRAYPAPPGN